MKKSILFYCAAAILFATNLDYNIGLTSSYGDSYDFYSYTENRLNMNFFYNNLQGWLQYEYSNPPELGNPINKLRKLRLEYEYEDWLIKFGDIYEIWGRGLILNQLDDQGIDFDNGIRGVYLGYEKDQFAITHINGESSIWQLGNDLRKPEYLFSHKVDALNAQYSWKNLSLGLSHLHTNEIHQKNFADTAFVNHRLQGAYLSYYGGFADLYLEYVDKQSTERFESLGSSSFEPLKDGYGFYGNINFFLGSWSLLTEYKRYSFDRLNPVDSDYVINHYGNRIDYQVMPILFREQNSTLLGRVIHQANINDERGLQLEINGGLPGGLHWISQYAHLSRNDTWQSVTTTVWKPEKLNDLMPSAKANSMPYWENYHEINGYIGSGNLFFRLGRGSNYEVPKITRFFKGIQPDTSYAEDWGYTDSTFFNNEWVFWCDTLLSVDTTTSIYEIESKLYQVTKSVTYPFEFTYVTNNGYSFSLNFDYQERTKKNLTKANTVSPHYSFADSAWVLLNPDSPDSFVVESTTQFVNNVDLQINRMISLTLNKSSQWSISLTLDYTNTQDVIAQDPYYNPLEALVYGDIKYFTGEREPLKPPSFIQRKWVALELAYHITPSQRVSMMYGSIQGGLFCSNGICRQIPAFNDGLRLTYSAMF